MAGSALPSRNADLQLPAVDVLLDDDLRAEVQALGQCSGDLAARVRDRHADGRAVGVGLDDAGQLRFVGDGAQSRPPCTSARAISRW